MIFISSGLNPSVDLPDIWILSRSVFKYREWTGTIWGISGSLTRSSPRGQQGAQRALPWTGNSEVFCNKKPRKKRVKLPAHSFPTHFLRENFTVLEAEI